MCILYGVIAIGRSLLRDAFDIRLCWRGFTNGISHVGYPDIKIIPDAAPFSPFCSRSQVSGSQYENVLHVLSCRS
jgi:hypothetical protein